MKAVSTSVTSALEPLTSTRWNMDIDVDGLLTQAVDALTIFLGVVWYPLWTIVSLCYGLWPSTMEVPFSDYIAPYTVHVNGEPDDSYSYVFPVGDTITKKEEGQNGKNKAGKVTKASARDKAIKSLIKIVSLDKAQCKSVMEEETESGVDHFAEDLKFNDPLVTYEGRNDWITSFNALTMLMSAKILDIENIRDESDITVVHLRMCWMTPFPTLNEWIGARGLELDNVMVIRFDESNRVCEINEFWNGRDHLDGSGVFGVMRKVTAMATVPICKVVSCIGKKEKKE